MIETGAKGARKHGPLVAEILMDALWNSSALRPRRLRPRFVGFPIIQFGMAKLAKDFTERRSAVKKIEFFRDLRRT